MNFQDFFENCRVLFSQNRLSPPNEAEAAKLFELTEIMLTVNQTMNLTAIKEEKAIILKHYVDSMLIAEHIPAGSTVLDVGCGAGFPTFPLAILRPDLQIMAMDSTAKRIQYVQNTAKTLELDNVQALACRAEEAAHTEMRESFDVVTARAVASLPVLCELCLPFAKIGGRFVAMKAKQAETELTESQNAIRLCGGRLADTAQYALTDGDSQEPRTVAIVSKLSATPQNYPRHFSKISKKPL